MACSDPYGVLNYDCDYNENDLTCVEGRTNMLKCNSAEADCDDFQLDGVHNIRASYENQTDYALKEITITAVSKIIG